MHAFRSCDFQDIARQSYDDRFKLLRVVEENLADMFETDGIVTLKCNSV